MKYILTLLLFVMNGMLNAQTAAADNKAQEVVTSRPFGKGPGVYGVFEGRPPCAGIAGPLYLTAQPNSEKIKCVLTLLHDSLTMQPTRFELLCIGAKSHVSYYGDSYSEAILQGRWALIKGMPGNSNADIIKLDVDKEGGTLYLLKGDDNILFVLNQNKQMLAGNDYFSYTLNRVQLVAAK